MAKKLTKDNQTRYKKPKRHQMWPFGYGTTLYGAGFSADGRRCIQFRPAEEVLPLGPLAEGAWEASVKANHMSSILIFKDAAAIDNLINDLIALRDLPEEEPE